MYKIEDLDAMARTIYGEARGEPPEGQVAVGWVIRNRCEEQTWYGKTIREVCLKKWQFSCWNEGDANFDRVQNVQLPDATFADCLIIAINVLCNFMGDPTTFGANHYHTDAVSPSWAEGVDPICRIGNHLFYKL